MASDATTPAPTDTPTPAPTPTSDAGGSGTAGDANAEVATGADAPTDETLIGGAKPAAGDGDAGEAGDPPSEDGNGDGAETGPPETYALKVTTKDDDGKDVEVELDAALIEKASPLFKEVGLTNEQANKLAPLALEVQQRMLQQIGDEHTARIADWAKAVKTDPDLGGAKWPQTETNIDRALTAFGAPSVKDADGVETNEFRTLLNDSGLGNNPTLARIFNNIGKALGEDDQLVRTDAVKPTKVSAEAELYPNDLPKAVKR